MCKKILFILLLLVLPICSLAVVDVNFQQGKGTNDSLGVDTNGDGTIDDYLYSTTAGAFHLKKGANITLTVDNDTVTIAGTAGAGTADSMGVDTDGDGTIDNYLYSTVAGAFHIKKGSNITLTVDTDTLTIASTGGGAGSEDSLYINDGLTEYSIVNNLIKFLESPTIYITREDSTTYDVLKFNADVKVSDSIGDSLVNYYTQTAVAGLVEDSLNNYSITSAIEALIEDSLNNYSITSVIKTFIGDSLANYYTQTAVEILIEDSLDEYSTTAAIEILIEDSLNGYSTTGTIKTFIGDSLAGYYTITAVEAVIEDSLNNYSITSNVKTFIGDSLANYYTQTAVEVLIEDSLNDYLYNNGAYTVATVDGTNGQVLKTDGIGAATWQNDAGSSAYADSAGWARSIREKAADDSLYMDDDTLKYSGASQLVIKGGGSYTHISNDLTKLGDDSDDDDVKLMFLAPSDSGGVQYDAATNKMQYSNDGGATWDDFVSGGTSDSMGVDTDGDGTVDNYLYSTVAGAFHLKKGSNITLTVLGDTVTIAGDAAAGTADSMGVDTDGNGTIDNYLYSTTAGAFHIQQSMGIVLTVDTDTLAISTDVKVSDSINDSLANYYTQDAVKALIEDSLNGYYTTGAVEAVIEDSLDGYYTIGAVEAAIEDSLNEYLYGPNFYDSVNLYISPDSLTINDGSAEYSILRNLIKLKEGQGINFTREDSTNYDILRVAFDSINAAATGALYIYTVTEGDSLLTTKLYTALLIEDSLDEYSTTSAIEALIEDSLNGYYTTGAVETIVGDSLQNYFDTATVNDSLALFLRLTGGTMSGDIAMGTNSITGLDYIDFVPQAGESHSEGRQYYNSNNKSMAYFNDEADVTLNIGREGWTRVYNNSGSTILDGQAVYITGGAVQWPTIALAKADNINTAKVLGLATHDIGNSENGYVTIYGEVHNLSTATFSDGDSLFLSADTAGAWVTVQPEICVPIGWMMNAHASNGKILVQLNHSVIDTQTVYALDPYVRTRISDTADILRAEMDDTANIRYDSAMIHLDGMAYDKGVVTLVQATGVAGIQFEVEKDGGGDIIFRIDGEESELDCTTGGGTGGKARVSITAGADENSVVTSYVYVTNSGGTATLASSTSLPTGSFAWVGRASIADTVTFNALGPFSLQRFTEAFTNDSRGTESYAREKLRELGAQYKSGVTPTLTIFDTPNPDTLHVDVTSGVVYQLHRQTFPSFTDGPYHYGNGLNIYEQLGDLSEALEELDGTSLSGTRFNLIIWGAVNQTTGDCKLFVNLPNGSYSNSDQAISDRDNTADYTVPSDMKTVAFLIARVVLRHQAAASGTWTALGDGIYSLLGVPLGSRTGGASSAEASNEFADSDFRVFDNSDPTKIIALEASGITTGNTRTMTVPDGDGTIAYLANIGDSLNNYFDTAAVVDTIQGTAFSLSDFDNSTIDTTAGGALQVKDAGVSLTTKVTGTLPEANGGTGVTDLSDILAGDDIDVTDGANTIIGGNATIDLEDAITLDSLTVALIDGDTVFAESLIVTDGASFSGDLDMNDNSILNATVTVSAIVGDADWFGNLNLWGMFNQLNNEIIYNVDNGYASPKNADTFLFLPTFAWIDKDGLGDTALWEKDSSCALHPSEVFTEGGWNGYRYLMVHSPIPVVAGIDSARFENPTFIVSNNGIDYAPFIDSFSTSPTYDSLTAQIATAASYSINWGGDATYFADPALFMDVDSTLWNINYVGFADGKHMALVMQYTQDGLNWFQNSGVDTFIVVDTTFATSGHVMVSPKIIREQIEGSVKYYIYMVRNHIITNAPDTSWLVRYVSDYVCSLYVIDTDWIGNTTYDAAFRFVEEKLWHMDLMQTGNSDLLMIGNFTDSSSGGSPADGYIRIGHSADMGLTWDWGDSNRYIDTTSVATTAWDSKYIYKAGGHIIHDGHRFGLSLLYSARDQGNSYWHTGRTNIWFEDTTTQIDSTGIKTDGIATSNINYAYEWIGFDGPALAYEGAPDDSSKVTFPGINSINSYVVLNVAGDLQSTPDIDTFSLVVTVPYPCSIDSIVYDIREIGGGKIDSIALDGPDISGGRNWCDSAYYTDATDRTGNTTIRIDVTDITVLAGQRYEVVFVTSLSADNDSIYINWLQLGIQR